MGGHFLPFLVTHTSSTLSQHPQNTLWNTPLDIFSSKYVLLWVREQNRAFIMDFAVICNFSPMGGHYAGSKKIKIRESLLHRPKKFRYYMNKTYVKGKNSKKFKTILDGPFFNSKKVKGADSAFF